MYNIEQSDLDAKIPHVLQGIVAKTEKKAPFHSMTESGRNSKLSKTSSEREAMAPKAPEGKFLRKGSCNHRNAELLER